MIKFTRILAKKPSDQYIVLLPGGPGLSSLTLRSLDILSRNFNLVYVDIQGTNGTSFETNVSFSQLTTRLADEIETKLKIQSEKIIVGHSFGGILAAALAIKLNPKGLICLATPFGQKTLDAVTEKYKAGLTPNLEEAASIWLKRKTDEAFKKWLSEYGELYFQNPVGKTLLLNDAVSANYFLANRSDAVGKDSLLDDLADRSFHKLMVVGKNDGLLSTALVEEDAKRGKFKFLTVENANHFLMFDQPKKVASLIEEQIATIE